MAGDYWRADYARQALDRIQTDPAALLAAYDLMTAPCPHDWLAERLRRLWKSSPVSGSLEASAWVSETGRLLSDIPQSILAEAIDAAVKNSARGFMPTVGEIRALAEPKMRELRLERWRLQQVIDAEPAADAEPEERCTPEEAAAILAKLNLNFPADKPVRAHSGPPEKPDREYWLSKGIDPDALESGSAAA